MTLRRRLILLHSAFAAFAVIAALATIYAIQFYTERVSDRLEAMINEAQLVENLRVDFKTLDVHLHELVTGRRNADAVFETQCDTLLSRLDDVVRFAGQHQPDSADVCAALHTLRGELAEAIADCVALVRANDLETAHRDFKERIEAGILSAMDVRLRRLRGVLDERRGAASGQLFARNAQLLVLSLLVALGGVGLVVAGAIVVRRRLVLPIARLKAATAAFAEGDLTYRVQVDSTDELGVLGASLNNMASSLRTSQRKFKSLFENQRDPVVVCTRAGTVCEIHDGDPAVLGAANRPIVGSSLATLWTPDTGSDGFWIDLVERVFARGETIRVNEVTVPTAHGGRRVLDVVAYPVDYADQPYAALVLRDAAERVRLQNELRRSETMTAAVTVARGIAHDFKNLLHSAVNTLTLLQVDAADPLVRERATTALGACEQAARLSRRLSRFAGTDRGNPEVLPLMGTVRVILDSLDEGFLNNVTVDFRGDERVAVEIDRDHLTQIVLNLLVNAREAMATGGTLSVHAATVQTADPRAPASPRPYAVLTVRDSGCGIAPEVLDRVFQPFFSSKQRGSHGPRGLGLAVVYALVNQAGGFILVESEPGRGSAFQVHLPIATDWNNPTAPASAASRPE
ncbi:MAG TPA: ATP-binding protein [Phycisphaerae bacterium]|nr:HAMP domain-containing protein [Phycisphaerales bacterium]HRX87115.1 ATP-binding protein [Phycisphaerae bacterium]